MNYIFFASKRFKEKDTVSESDVDNLAYKYRFDVLISEFEALRNEIVVRINGEQNVINFSIIVLGAIIASLGAIVVNKDFNPEGGFPLADYAKFRSVCLLFSIIYSSLSMVQHSMSMMIADIGKYIQTVWAVEMKELLKSLSPDFDNQVMQWESFHNDIIYNTLQRKHVTYLQAIASQILPTGFACLFFIFYVIWLYRTNTVYPGCLEILLICLSALALFSVIFSTISAAIAFLKLGGKINP